MKKIKTKMWIVIFLYTLTSVFITGCSNIAKQNQSEIILETSESSTLTRDIYLEETTSAVIENFFSEETTEKPKLSQTGFNLSDIPKYSGELYSVKPRFI